MCDGLGRQFSHSCPNTTLFQQRMLVCDHWYMVNCSKSENDYKANLLIGQRDKPFVSEFEHELRTPRPDLSDQPYSSDYSGDSFRSQFKVSAAIQNAINGINYKKVVQNKVPDAPEPQQFNPKNQAPFVILNPEEKFNDRRNIRGRGEPINIEDDSSIEAASSSSFVKSPLNLNVRASPGIESKEPELFIIRTTEPISLPSIIKPSMYYQAPELYPLYNLNYKEAVDQIQKLGEVSRISSPAPFAVPTTTSKPTSTTDAPRTTSSLGIIVPHSEPKKIVSIKQTHNDYDFSKYFRGAATAKPTQTTTTTTTTTRTSTTTPTTTPKPTTTFAPTTTQSIPQPRILNKQPAPGNNLEPPLRATELLLQRPQIKLPPTELLPPYETTKTYDDSTTQGPPIYYEWKWAGPAWDLEPPKLNSSEEDSKEVSSSGGKYIFFQFLIKK